jgi:hypothetical protein
MDIKLSGNGELYTNNSNNVIIEGTSEVIVEDAITFTRGNQVVGKLDYKIDFSDLDPSLHEKALNLITGKRINLALEIDHD